jgi:asparagine synthase (glutamine-hydrolysing)
MDLAGGPIDRGLLARMNDRQHHRGPDEGSEHVEPGLGFGHRRLSIIDVATGQQPIGNEDGTIILIYNGEIYNFQELAKELAALGHVFKTHSDTEVVVHAWEQWGEDCVKRFNGMFAFALWDRPRQSLFLARDRLGKKPLYYSVTPAGQLLFGSELKALLCDPRLPRDVDAKAVEEYFTFGYVPDPRTILRGVVKLQPAHTLLVRRAAPLPQQRRYWDVSFATRTAGGSVEDLCAELRSRLRHAVELRLISEVPLGAFLSGGVDSSAVVAMMASLSTEPVNTCSISFDVPSFDESVYAREVAERLATRHYVESVKVDDFDLIDRLVDVYDEPFADSSAIPTYRVCQLARKRVTVALSGDGGDESFAGYRRYRLFANEERVRGALPLGLRRTVFGALGRCYPKLDWAPRFLRAKTTFQELALDSVAGYLNGVSIVPQALRTRLYSDSFRSELQGYTALEVFREHARHAEYDDPLSLAQYLDFKTYLPGDILTKVDRASMAHSLEVRVPLLDYQLVEWVAGLPADLKLRGGQGKYIFKKSLEPVLSARTLHRPKMGFAVPLADWFRGPLRERLRQMVLESSLTRCGMFDAAELRSAVDLHQSGRRDYSALLWALLMFDGFQQRVLGGT